MKKEDDNDMAFLEHLEELRWRIVRALIAVLIFAVAIWFLKEWIIQHVFIAMSKPDFISFQLMCNYFGICIEEIPIRFQSNQVAAQFTYALYMCVVGGFIVAFPYVFYQFWSFIKPGLKAKEIQAARGITVSVSVLFLLGVGFGYFVVAPLCVNFFGDFQLAAEFENIWKIDSFMSMIISSVIFTGLLFLLPVVAYIFTKLGLITSVFLKKYRKHAIVGVLIVAAFITPPDFISQIIVVIPILILYEISILISRRVEPKYK
ncbi:MAG: twin-arginine translocase subunit TatC [Brumimicrobium sp.]|nr:twin-arginine translocase subunit TatC [Brumimicrobium sp.]